MVVRIINTIHFLQTAVCRPRSSVSDAAGIGWTRFQHRLIVDPETLQLVARVTEISNLKHKVIGQLPLDVEHPLLNVRCPHILNIAENLRLSQASARVSGTREPLAL